MRNLIRTVPLLLGLGSIGTAQQFEVASIRQAETMRSGAVFFGPARGGPGTESPAQITWQGANLRSVIMTAFNMKDYQINGPVWLASERFDFAVSVPEGATKEQLPMMWRHLLEERFGLKFHIEQKEFQVDELVVGKGGHKLQETTLDASQIPLVPTGPPKFEDGKLAGPGMVTMIMMEPGASTPKGRVMAKAQTLEPLAAMLGNQVGHPVIDKTGLTGRYDFEFEFTPNLNGFVAAGAPALGGGNPNPPLAAEIGVDLPTAVAQNLGLRLEKSKADLDYLVIEKMEKSPTEN